MALNGKSATPVAPVAPKTQEGAKRNRSANEEIIAQGNAIIAQMSEEERANLGSLSHTLHFKHLLGLASKKDRRKVSKDETRPCSKAVGIVFVSDIDIEVPEIDINLNSDTGIRKEDIKYRKVKAGEEFFLSYYEYMYLITRNEYAGLCEANGDPKGAYFSPKLPAFYSGDKKLPTPTINLKSGSVKENMIDIDVKTEEGWKIKPGYEKFEPLLKKSRPRRASGSKNTTPTPTLVSVALRQILDGM